MKALLLEEILHLFSVLFLLDIWSSRESNELGRV